MKHKVDIKPLYMNDGICIVPNLPYRMEVINDFKEDLKNGTLRLVDNDCLCHNKHPENDIVISEKDRYGFAIKQIICSKCGLIRSGQVLDEPSNRLFYEKYYRGIYLGTNDNPAEALYKDEYRRGQNVYKLIDKYIPLKTIHKVAEIGCGAGGCLAPFLEAGMAVSGYDYDKRYLDYGQSRGINLFYGDFYELADDDSFDLIILNHVFEHFIDPIKEIKRLLPKLKVGGCIFIEVPGIFNIHKSYFNPLRYFQNAHVYNFYKEYLIEFFSSFNLHVLMGNDRCQFLVKKCFSEIPDVEYVYNPVLSNYPNDIKDYLVRLKRYYILYSIYYKIRGFFRKMAIICISKFGEIGLSSKQNGRQ